MKLYNTLTRNIDELVPRNPNTVTMYTCGPTVYDYAHVGHWFTYVRWDTVIRTLKAEGYDVQWVMNITDVGHLVSDADEGEDKLEKGARREGKTAWEVAEFYTKDFVAGLNTLAITPPTHMPKATDHIAEQIELIQQLEEKGYTYTIDDGVYYDTSKFEGYAAFARLDLDDLQAGARVEYNSQKRQPSDFALWKFSPKDQLRDMEWDSPWGKGFPGWHIECSAMSMKYLGETLDIHTGGIDHIPVHHTNEIAQSEAATGKRFANVWMHSNHVMVNGEKIAKSAGNGIQLTQIVAAGFDPSVLRLHILESHYRSQSKFSWEALEASKNRLMRWRRISDLRWQVTQGDDSEIEEPVARAAQLADSLQPLMAHDLDTPKVLASIDELLDIAESTGMHVGVLDHIVRTLQFINRVLGIDLFTDDITAEIRELLDQRKSAREAKDWAESDRIRQELHVRGIGVNDTADGAVTWYHES